MGLFGALQIAVQSLLADQGAIDVASNNVANVNTPGYSREEAVLTELPPQQFGNVQFGTGVELQTIQADRSNILELRLNQETQQQGSIDTEVQGLNQIQALFNDNAGSGLGSVISAFFNSFQQLASDPSNVGFRDAVLAAAQNMTAAFRQTAGGLVTQQQDLNQSVVQQVGQINQLTAQIAQLNDEVAAAQTGTSAANTLVDQRGQLITQLSQLLDVTTIDAGNGTITLTTNNGNALVVGTASFALSTQANATTGLQDVFAQGQNITSQITAGSLGGTLALRDQEIPKVLTSLDTLASGIATSVNSTNAAGFDLNGNPGGNFFVPPPAGAGAALNFNVAITDPSLIAASSDGTSGSNGNANALAALATQNITGNQTPTTFYAGIVSAAGNDAAAAQARQQSVSLLVQQLKDQRGAVSGVSLDEEAANLAKFQTAFDAAARIVTVVDNLTQTVINMAAS
ncbi:MAG: flagellar hook-associated protein FlgK [Candidatus Acidiferrales bacterium]